MTEQALKLGDCAKVISGYAFKSKDFVDEGVPVLKIANIKHEHVVFDGVQYLPPDFLNIDDKFKVKFGDVMICLTGSHISQPNSVVGRVAMYRHERMALLNQRAGRIIINDTGRLDKDFLYYFLRQEKVMHDLALNAGGAANQANISPKDVERIELPDIDILSQKSISSTLKAYDDLIENNKRRIELLEESARQLYKEWFVRFRFPGHEHVKIIDGVPEGWRLGTYGDAFEFLGGFAFKSKSYTDDGKYGVVTIKNVHDSRFVPECPSRVEQISDKLKEHCKLVTGDILLSLTGNVGRACIVFGSNYLLNQRVAKLATKNGVTPEFAYWTFTDKGNQRKIVNLAYGVAQLNLSPVKLAVMELVIPPITLIEQFSDITSPIFNQIIQLNLANQELAKARDLILPKLMNGEITV